MASEGPRPSAANSPPTSPSLRAAAGNRPWASRRSPGDTQSPEAERRAADYLNDKLKGFGPKQSRNLLQWIGLSRYEVPIDSRITKWLNEFGFPVRLTAKSLGDRHYYHFVSTGFQKLSEACGIVPCVLDAAIFASYDGDGWTDENVVW